ncbi:MAG: M48 family metalloprotease, partial [Elusimicrobia bacterium]|nr:M48 family metalloprotease [Elusimicrobiota bacterium]
AQEPVKPPRVDLSSYRQPASTALPARLFIAAHGLGLAVGVLALGAALGWAIVPAAALVGGAIAWQLRRADFTADKRLAYGPEHGENVRSYVGEILDGLMSRMGIDPALKPQIVVTNERGTMNAIAEGRRLGPDAKILVGEEIVLRPVDQLEGTLAHELGHLVHGDFTPGRFLRTPEAMGLGLGVYARVALWGAAAHVPFMIANLPGSAQEWLALGASVAVALLFAGAGYLVAAIGHLFGIAALRWQEHGADGFARLLVGRSWADYLESSWTRQGKPVPSLLERLRRPHPTYPARLRRLRG